MPKEKSETFEQLYARLEERVGKLERGGLSLDQSIALYEEGMTLARQCQEQLDSAELKITKLKESLAPLPRPQEPDAASGPDEVEYVDDDAPIDEDDPFA